MKRRILLMLVPLLALEANAQNVNVSGIVTESSGAPLPGVTVLQSGTSNGVSTDDQGCYSITVPPGVL